ncbi:MAG: M48 family metalloprotease, partial [Cytophagales bacterium]|nr:M48 family metalloprotease [Armatimonadota bacterium]
MIKRFSGAAAAVFLLGGTILGGVATSGCSGGRFGNTLSKSDQVRIGQQAAGEIEQKNRVITSGPQYEQLQRVAARIIPLARQDFDVPYTVKLIDSKEVNAFALPGGPIYFYKGLVDITTSDDELASVVGHEAAHVIKQHSAKQISDAQAKNII